MGLLKFARFSSIPNFRARSKRVQKEKDDVMLRSETESARTYIAERAFSSTGADQTIFTVPEDKEFILLTAFISQNATNASGAGLVDLKTTNTSMPDIASTMTILPPSNTTITQSSIALNFGRGLRFEAETIFTLEAGSSQAMVGGISGYLIEVKLKS